MNVRNVIDYNTRTRIQANPAILGLSWIQSDLWVKFDTVFNYSSSMVTTGGLVPSSLRLSLPRVLTFRSCTSVLLNKVDTIEVNLEDHGSLASTLEDSFSV